LKYIEKFYTRQQFSWWILRP